MLLRKNAQKDSDGKDYFILNSSLWCLVSVVKEEKINRRGNAPQREEMFLSVLKGLEHPAEAEEESVDEQEAGCFEEELAVGFRGAALEKRFEESPGGQ